MHLTDRHDTHTQTTFGPCSEQWGLTMQLHIFTGSENKCVNEKTALFIIVLEDTDFTTKND